MDLKLAKKIIIISLIITNIILFGFIYKKEVAYMDETNQKPFIEKTVELLKKKNIEVEAKVPKQNYNMNTLSVEFETSEIEDLNKVFFGGTAEVEDPQGENGIIRGRDKTLILINRRRIIYEDQKPNGYNVQNIENAIDATKDFLLKHEFKSDDLILVRSEKNDDGTYDIEYRKSYDQKLLETSYTNFTLNRNGIQKMDRLWLNVLEQSGKKLSTGSASKALLTLLDKQNLNKKTIVKIEPCYYFDPEEQGYLDDITKALRGRAIPSWRIEFKDGSDIIIEKI
ncbi:two-component system regulatory protein YycI [Peptoniphilus sp. BV3AC2]|uniref:two-component system regulatory protein YycI n=1 Tax=Peptoniphilus sp. BV3AC2 TaxID=1111133 RepID=UPI0003B8BBC3|nr:two-component system regulatory protein YycI [Peptoniphilus sp. BV3AC2]ERT63784.1 YycH protein [Peptoniphilus sp. BV3AC2]